MTVLDYHNMLRHRAAIAKDDWRSPAEYIQMMESCTHIWNEDACAGYLIKALERAGLSANQIITILGEFYIETDEPCIDDAAAAAKAYLKDFYAQQYSKEKAD